MEQEEKIEICSICNNEFNINRKDNSGYIGNNFAPICAGCREDESI